MIFNLQETNYEKNIIPFIKNGIIVDTSVILIFFEGIINVRVGKKDEMQLPEFQKINWLIQHLKLEWKKFYVTPHILTEVCTNIRKIYNKKDWDFAKVFREILPFLSDIKEENIEENQIIKYIDPKNPIMELGDISIYLKADNFIQKNEKVAILAKDYGFTNKYHDDRNVLLFDLHCIAMNEID